MPTTHKVVRGDTLVRIAQRYGFRDWRTIWDDVANKGLRDSRQDDPGALQTDDELTIPDKITAKQVECTTDGTHTFVVKSLKAYVHQRLLDEHQQPFKKTKYRMAVDGKTLDGTTDDDGVLEVSVPADAQEAVITVIRGTGDEVTYPKLKLGMLDAIETDTGVQARLQSLGYDCPVDGDLTTDKSRAAVKAFQARSDLTQSGDVDQATRNAVRDAYARR